MGGPYIINQRPPEKLSAEEEILFSDYLQIQDCSISTYWNFHSAALPFPYHTRKSLESYELIT